MVAEADWRRALSGERRSCGPGTGAVCGRPVLRAPQPAQLRTATGSSIGADLGALADQPRVQVVSVTQLGPERARLVLRPELEGADLDLVVVLREGELGFELLHDWNRDGSLLAIVIPPGSRLVRLRSIDDLQPLTLRRAD